MAFDLGVVILNWNTRDYLRKCLASVFASRGVTMRVVVVDNASGDGSPDMVRAEFPQAELIVSPVNGGFSYGNNLGLRRLGLELGARADETTPRYGLLLNPDTVTPPDAFAEMVHFMDADSSIGAAGPKLVLLDGSLDLACRRSFPSPAVSMYHMLKLSKLFPHSRRFARYNMTYLDENELAEVDAVVGAFMMVRREVIARVGLLDETFFMYGEDLDWAYRIKEAGWRIFYNPAEEVLHVKRASSRHNQRAQEAFYEAMLIFYHKHYRATTPWWLHWLVMGGLLVKGGRPVWRALRAGPTDSTG